MDPVICEQAKSTWLLQKALDLRTQGHHDDALHLFLKAQEIWAFPSTGVPSRAVKAFKEFAQIMNQIAQIVNEKGESVDIVDNMRRMLQSFITAYSSQGTLKKETQQEMEALTRELTSLRSTLRKALNMEGFEPQQEALKGSGKIPLWAWGFAIIDILALVLTRGGAIPGVISFGAAGICLSTARTTPLSVTTRLVICTIITVTVWGLAFFWVYVVPELF